MEAFQELLYKYRWQAVAALGGLILLGAGTFLFRAGVFQGTKIEVIEEARLRQGFGEAKAVVVEIAGAVIRPGVYELSSEDRVEQLLIAAGGLSAEADRAWVEKNLNRAARLLDGQKVYVPALGETNTPEESPQSGASYSATSGVGSRININTATAAELDTLWGIGPARAEAIVDGRPYASPDELLAKKVIPQNVFEKIKNEITAP